MVATALAAAEKGERRGFDLEVIDMRTLVPFDEATILASVAKTGRVVIVHEAPRTSGFGAELAATIAEKAILHLQAPIVRVTGFDTPFPYTLEHEYLPDPDRVLDAVERVVTLLMIYEFRLPDIGEGVAEGEVVRWLVKEGDVLHEDQPMVEIMTDKATVEIPTPRAGRVARRCFAEGQVCPVGKVLIEIEVAEAAAAAKGEAPDPRSVGPAGGPPAVTAAAERSERKGCRQRSRRPRARCSRPRPRASWRGPGRRHSRGGRDRNGRTDHFR